MPRAKPSITPVATQAAALHAGPAAGTGVQAEAGPSKTRVKQAMLALQDLGADLVDLPADALARLQLDDALHDAVRAAQRIQAHGGRRRQVLYVGKLVRALPAAEQQRLREALEARRRGHAADSALLHQAERWRERLLDDDRALTELLRLHPGADAQVLGQLIRRARAERQSSQPPRAYRELFQHVKALLAPPPADDDLRLVHPMGSAAIHPDQ